MTKHKHDVLVINSYAGSLQIAARQAGFKIRGSYEDAGFGIEAQKLNFPGARYVDKLPWPKDDLRGTIVIAHPPCAAFSMQIKVNRARYEHRLGTKADVFQQHREVMEHALSNGCAALAMESVPGALVEAEKEHGKYAKKYGYNMFRVLQNAATFGVPQWRRRFWVMFAKLPALVLEHVPLVKPVSSILVANGDEAPNHTTSRVIEHLKKSGWSSARIAGLFEGDVTGSLAHVVCQKLGLDTEETDEWNAMITTLGTKKYFASDLPKILNPEEPSWFVLMSKSAWFANGRPLYRQEYEAAMGFPKDWRWPSSMLPEFRTYLSKGVCPPVARWVLEQLEENLNGRKKANTNARWFSIEPGEVADLNITKKEAADMLRGKQTWARYLS